MLMNIENNFQKKQGKYFDEFVDLQISKTNKDFFENNAALSAEYGTIFNLFSNIEDKTILDIGCGRGRYSLRMAKIAKEVVGVDISEKSIDFANSTAKKYQITNFKGIITDYSKPLYCNYFDYILMVNLLHHVEDMNLILKNARESLKENGSLVIFEFNPLNILFIPFLFLLKQIKSHFNKEYFRSNIFTLKKYIENNDFEIVYFERYAFLPTSLYNYSPLFKKINSSINKIPLVNLFSAFHIFKCKK